MQDVSEEIGLDRCSSAVFGLDHPEGVCVDADGTVYAGGEAGQVYRVDLAAKTFEQVASTGGFLLGLCADAAGLLYACDILRREVVRIDPRAGTVEVYSNGLPDRPMINPNWPAFDDAGNLYVTDSGNWGKADGWIWRIRPGGATEVWSERPADFPNGTCLTADGSALLVLESMGQTLQRVPIGDDGSAGEPEVIARFPGTVPDGVTIDDAGNAYVCHYRPDRIDRVSPAGEVEVLAHDPKGTILAAPTNAVWVGGDLLVGNLARWHLTRVRVGARGVPMRYPSL